MLARRDTGDKEVVALTDLTVRVHPVGEIQNVCWKKRNLELTTPIVPMTEEFKQIIEEKRGLLSPVGADMLIVKQQ